MFDHTPEEQAPAWIVPAYALIQCLQVIGEKLLYQLNHAIAMVSLRRIIRLLFERRKGIGDGHRAFAHRQERMIILSIAYANDIVRGKLHLAERRSQPRTFIHPGRSVFTCRISRLSACFPRSTAVAMPGDRVRRYQV